MQETIQPGTKNKASRLFYVDLAKGIMILLVVSGHIIQCYFSRAEKEPLHSFIYSFHTPLFFLICGYVMGLTQKKLQARSFKQWFLSKVQTLLLPYVVWRLLVYRFIDPVLPSPFSLDSLISLVDGSKEGGAWFLGALFCIQVVCYPIFRYEKLYTWIIPVSFLIVGNLLGGSFFYFNIYHYFGFLFGFIIYKYRNYILRTDVATIALLVFILSCLIYPNPSILTASAGMVLIYVCQQIDDLQRHSWLSKRIAEFGLYSLTIYLIHVLIVFPVSNVGIDVSIFRQTPILIICLIIAFGVSTLCVYISKLIEFFPMLNFILFGKKT